MLKECDVSLPKKATLVCNIKRFTELNTMKTIWKLKVSPYGFALSDVSSPWIVIARDFIRPFTRFYLEGYLQTVLTTDLSQIVYNSLVNSITHEEISDIYNYRILSKFSERSAKLGGVRVTFCLIVGLCLFVSLFICSSYYHYCHCHTAIEWSVCTQKAQRCTCKLMENAMTITDDTLKCL